MDPRNLYTLYFKQGQSVKSGFVVASSFAKAEEVGKAYCDGVINRRYIRVEKAVLAEEGQPIEESGSSAVSDRDPKSGVKQLEAQVKANPDPQNKGKAA